MISRSARRAWVGCLAAAWLAGGGVDAAPAAPKKAGPPPAQIKNAQNYLRASREAADKGDRRTAEGKLKTAASIIGDLAKRNGKDHESVQALEAELQEAQAYLESKSEPAESEPAGGRTAPARARPAGRSGAAGGKRPARGGGADGPQPMYVSEAKEKLARAKKSADRGLAKNAQSAVESAERLINNLAKKHGEHEVVQELLRELEETKAYVAPKLEQAQARAAAKSRKAEQRAEMMSGHDPMASDILSRLDKAKERADKRAGRPDAADEYARARAVFDEARSDIQRIVAKRKPEDVEMLEKAIAEAESHVRGALGDALAKQAASVRPPKDVYRGKDKADLERRIREKWGEKRPGEPILGVRFDQESWVARKEKVYNDAINKWQIYDEESLRVAVIAKSGETLAVIYDVFPRKDHTQGGGVELGGFSFREEMLASNFK